MLTRKLELKTVEKFISYGDKKFMRDLTNALTVFVIDAGNNPNTSACLNALNRQTCKFKIDIIKDYKPMSLAFQEMLNRVTTPLLIQVDNDMVVNDNAIEKMWLEIEGNRSPANISMHCYKLRDVHLDFEIYGIKIYKSELFKRYPFNLASPSCEVEQLSRMKSDGYDIVFKTDVVGEHSPHWTNELIFERYYNLMEKFKLYRYKWMEDLPKKLWDKVKANPSDLNMYALSGALSSVYSNKTMDEEKDFSKKRENFGKLLGYLDQPHQATLYMTSKCNHRCQWCYREHGIIEQAPDMTPSLAEVVIKKFPSIKGICICGFGEPLASDNLFSVVDLLKNNNKYVGLITNGSLLTKRFKEFNQKPDYISMSLNAHCKEEHEKTTGVKTWDDVIAGIKLVNSSSVPLYVSSVVTKQNIKYVPEMLKLLKSLNVQTVHLHNVLPHIDITKNNTFWDDVLQKEDEHLIDELKNLPEAGIVKIFPTLIDKSGGKNSCDFGWYSFSVNGNGSLSFCNSVLPCDKKYGNISDFVIWNSETAQKFRSDFCNKKLEHCSMCFRNWRVR